MIAELRAAAEAFAREAGELTLRYFGRPLEHDAKEDGTPVTVADRGAEALLRERIERDFPDHGILGEELGETRPGAPVRWIIDPIDGTKSFVRGVPLYAVLVGVEVEGEPVVGVAHFPALDETVAAGRGLGCIWDGGPCRVSDADDLGQALVLTTNVSATLASPYGEGWEALQRRASLSRGWGDAYGHILVATGRAEVMVDPQLFPWDAAPLLPILEEAGGRFTTLDGRANIHGGSGLSSNGVLHERALELLSVGD